MKPADPLYDPASFEDLFEHAPCGYAVLNLDGEIVQANAAFRELARLDGGKVIGASFRNLLGAAGALFFDTHLLPTLLLSGRRKEIALDLRTSQGRVPVLVNFTVQYAAGEPAAIRAVLLDAAERRLFERNLLRSRKEAEQLAEVILHSSDAIITSHVDGRIRNWNNGASEMFGYSSGEATGGLLAELILPADQRESLAKAMREVERGREYAGEIVACRKDGSQFEASIKLTPHMEAPGTFVASSAVLRDISLQKRAERALLQNEKLASVGRLASSIAHEINNPLASVTNLLYILDLQVPTPELKALVTTAQEELARVSQITTHTLRFHRQSSSPADLNVTKLFESVVGLYRARLRNSNVVAKIGDRAATELRCHEGELRQIVLNIVGNALDAMKNGGVLHLRCRDSKHRGTGEAGVRIVIADSGTGMDKATLARIFEPFFSTKGIGGTGLGLWVTQDLVQKNKGRMAVRSSNRHIPRGTVFSLFFPFR
ncbi:PAS domain S-box-containing protein [Granulicella rosea]|uniref:histidine kinase n=1 Tax=Granulicella rosea TaxID=474952 RepID=A0A239J269_9BACT|nr:PAS domain S-box protein [Granulicella rosea]SNS99363.1 PAS domain S-box-containing protein [Granulicella rosea]